MELVTADLTEVAGESGPAEVKLDDEAAIPGLEIEVDDVPGLFVLGARGGNGGGGPPSLFRPGKTFFSDKIIFFCFKDWREKKPLN